MRFRVPEIFLGAFLAVAVFAMGILFASSWPDSKQTAQAITSQQTEKHSEKAKTPDDELIGSTWLTKDAAGFFTFWLVVVGVGQVILFYVQLRLISAAAVDAEKAGIAAERAADATTASVDLARSTAEKQLRAYVLVTNIAISGVEPDATPTANIIFKNSGQTPASDLQVFVAMALIDYPPKSQPIDDEPSPVGSVTVLGPNSEYVVPAALIGHLGTDQYIAIHSGAQAIHIVGTIKYRDAFGISRHTNFNSFYGGDFGTNNRGAPAHAPTGNDAT
jgi:Na+-transporting methylmalonyl-CoA/oxaloacetate decarboxylase gamma subunit